MDRHAIVLLKAAEDWGWSITLYGTQLHGNQDRKFDGMAPKLLSGFIEWSQKFGGDLLHIFWDSVKASDLRLKAQGGSNVICELIYLC